MQDPSDFQAFLSLCADDAGGIALRYFRQDLTITEKDDRSPVTKADREIERAFRNRLAATYPEHGIIGEEFGAERADAEYVWVIDPIDGTRAFMTGKPLFGTIIGLLHRGRPVLGLVDQPFTKERWMGQMDRWATFNGEPIKVAAPRRLDNARMFIGSPNMFDGPGLPNYLSLCRAARWPQYGCDCYAYGLLAMGCADLVVECRLGLHDAVGLAPIVTGAGGYIADWSGKEIGREFSGTLVAASDRALADEALEILTSV